MTLPRVGVFHVSSDDRVVQATAVRRLFSFVRQDAGLSFSGRRVLLNPDHRWLSLPFYRQLVKEAAVALNKRCADVFMSDDYPSGEGQSGTSPFEPLWRTIRLRRDAATTMGPHPHRLRLPQLSAQFDLVVNVACLHTEPRMRLAGAIFNTSRLLCARHDPERSELANDADDFNAAVVDVASRLLPDLNLLVVPEVIRKANGADCDQAQILASTDIVAVDALAASLAGYAPQEIPAISLAAESGLGIGWPEAIRLVGDCPQVCRAIPSESLFADHLHKEAATANCGLENGRLLRSSAYLTRCPGEASMVPSASVVTCVGQAKCDLCGQCAGDSRALVN